MMSSDKKDTYITTNRISINSKNSPAMINYNTLESSLKDIKNVNDQTVWGLVRKQQEMNVKESQVAPTVQSQPLPVNPAAQQTFQQSMQMQFPRISQFMILLQDPTFKQEVKALLMQQSMSGKPNSMLMQIKPMLHMLGLA